MNTLEIKKLFQQYSKKKSIRYGLPIVLFCIGGSVYMREFTKIRYKYRRTTSVREKAIEIGAEVRPAEETTLEAAYEEYKEANLDDWENKRIDRPWKE